MEMVEQPITIVSPVLNAKASHLLSSAEFSFMAQTSLGKKIGECWKLFPPPTNASRFKND